MKITIERKFSVTLCLSIFLLLFSLNQPVTYAAGYTYGNYYNNNLTNTTAGTTQAPSINGKGDKITFWSNQDLVGNTNSSNQVFLWTSPSTITQISSLDVSISDVGSTLPSINFTGDRVAYIKDTGASANKFLMLWKSGVSTAKIAPALGKVIDSCKISGNGTKVVFRSNNAFISGPDTTYELYLWDDPNTFTKITSTQSANAPDTAFSITYDGTLVAFVTKENSSGDTLLGSKNPDGNYELYLWNKNDSSTTQIASSSGGIGSIEPSVTSYTISTTTVTGTMTKIAFCSDADILGNNPDRRQEIFLWTYPGTYTANSTSALTQITSTSKSGGACRNPQISKDGKFVTFVSNIDILSGGKTLLTDGISAIFVWNSSGAISQINTKGDNPVISSYTGLKENDTTILYGPRIAYYSTADGSDDIYLVTSTIPVPATSRWGLIILILVLVSLAVFMLKRRRQTSKGKV